MLFLVPGEVGGSEVFLTNLTVALAEEGHDIVVFAPKGFHKAHHEVGAATEIVEAPWSTGAQVRRIISEHSWLQFEAKRRRLQILHHGVGTAPFWNRIPSLTTIYDVQYLHYPQNFVRTKRFWLRLNVPFTIAHSKALCVPSNFVRSDLFSRLDIEDPLKIHVVPLGSENLFPEGTTEPERVRKQYGLDRPYFLYPGRTYPHKNHHLLLRAYAPVAEKADLVLTGPRWFLDRELNSAANRLGLIGKVKHLGQIPRADLGALYRGATALVYPTRFEGFGAPLLEAMSLDCPVIASDVASIPEVAGDSAILLNPDDLEGWAESMENLLENASLRYDLALRGRTRAAEFTWRRSAELQMAAYDYALNK